MELSLDGVVRLIIFLIIACGVFYLLDLLIRTVVTVEPYRYWLRTVLKVLAILVAINLLLGLAGVHIIRFT